MKIMPNRPVRTGTVMTHSDDNGEVPEVKTVAIAATSSVVGDLPALSGMTKDELIAAAKAEKVTKAEDADGKSIPFAEGTNDQMRAAIEAKRA